MLSASPKCIIPFIFKMTLGNGPYKDSRSSKGRVLLKEMAPAPDQTVTEGRAQPLLLYHFSQMLSSVLLLKETLGISVGHLNAF